MQKLCPFLADLCQKHDCKLWVEANEDCGIRVLAECIMNQAQRSPVKSTTYTIRVPEWRDYELGQSSESWR